MRITDINEVSRLFVAGEGEAVDHDLAAMIARTGALLRGHFRLQSGLHSEYFLRFGQLAFRRTDAEEIALKCLDALPQRPRNPIVLTVETAPRYLAQALGDRLHAPLSIAKANAERRPTTKGIDPSDLDGRAVLVVADVISSGDSIRPLVELAKRQKSASVHLVAFATLHRDGCAAILRKLDVSGTCLLHAAWPTYDRDACPLCETGGELLPGFELN